MVALQCIVSRNGAAKGGRNAIQSHSVAPENARAHVTRSRAQVVCGAELSRKEKGRLSAGRCLIRAGSVHSPIEMRRVTESLVERDTTFLSQTEIPGLDIKFLGGTLRL